MLVKKNGINLSKNLKIEGDKGPYMIDTNLFFKRKQSGVPILSWEQVDKLVEAIIKDFCPQAIETPQAINVEGLVEQYLHSEQEYQYLSNNGLYLGMTVFNDTDKVIVYDSETNRAEYMSVKAGTIIIDNSLLEDGQEHRFRFTIGHEVGHVLLHGPYFGYNPDQIGLFDKETNNIQEPFIRCRKNIIFQRGSRPIFQTDNDWMEWQANAIASAILMPRHAVLKLADNCRSNPPFSFGTALSRCEQMALSMTEVFNVSSDAALYRMQRLGILREEAELELKKEEIVV